jgi:arginase family enzyme
MSDWPSIQDLLTHGPAHVALLGAPMNLGAVTPGHYDRAPTVIRKALRRIGTYDIDAGSDLATPVADLGDVDIATLSIEDGFRPVRDAVLAATTSHDFTILLGGHNGITRPAVHGLGLPLDQVGLITLDAHFDLRDTASGLLNGNPIRALLEDGLPGRNICQIGIAPFANTAAMHKVARDSGIGVVTIGDWQRSGPRTILDQALARLDRLQALVVDFDIDVIDRSQFPGAPGARPGGMPVTDFLAAARLLTAHPKVRLVDLTEFDPSLDATDLSSLTAGRWMAEILAGYEARPLPFEGKDPTSGPDDRN